MPGPFEGWPPWMRRAGGIPSDIAAAGQLSGAANRPQLLPDEQQDPGDFRSIIDTEFAEFLTGLSLLAKQRVGWRASFGQVPFMLTAGQTLQLRPQEDRTYLFIINTSATNVLYIGIGYEPTAVTGIPFGAAGFYEPFVVPDNNIFGFCTAAVTGILLYANALR